MSDASVILPPGDDTSMEITTPIGFAFGGSLHHQIYVSQENPLYEFYAMYVSRENPPDISSIPGKIPHV